MSATAAPFAFVDGALDRAEHLRDDAVALDALWTDATVLSLDADGRAATAADGAPSALTGTDLGARPE
ncbi:MAG: NAD(+) diphosphatase, partial [Luteimonas sp.]